MKNGIFTKAVTPTATKTAPEDVLTDIRQMTDTIRADARETARKLDAEIQEREKVITDTENKLQKVETLNSFDEFTQIKAAHDAAVSAKAALIERKEILLNKPIIETADYLGAVERIQAANTEARNAASEKLFKLSNDMQRVATEYMDFVSRANELLSILQAKCYKYADAQVNANGWLTNAYLEEKRVNPGWIEIWGTRPAQSQPYKDWASDREKL